MSLSTGTCFIESPLLLDLYSGTINRFILFFVHHGAFLNRVPRGGIKSVLLSRSIFGIRDLNHFFLFIVNFTHNLPHKECV